MDGDISDSIVDRLDLDDSEEDYLLDVLSKLGDDWDPEDPLTFNQDESDILETLLKKCKDDECSFKKSFAA